MIASDQTHLGAGEGVWGERSTGVYRAMLQTTIWLLLTRRTWELVKVCGERGVQECTEPCYRQQYDCFWPDALESWWRCVGREEYRSVQSHVTDNNMIASDQTHLRAGEGVWGERSTGVYRAMLQTTIWLLLTRHTWELVKVCGERGVQECTEPCYRQQYDCFWPDILGSWWRCVGREEYRSVQSHVTDNNMIASDQTYLGAGEGVWGERSTGVYRAMLQTTIW